MRRPWIVWLLVASLVFLALGGLYGGIAMLIDPTGGLLQMTEVLPALLVPDFTLPGLFLLVVMGVLPILVIYGLLARAEVAWAAAATRWSGHHWAWTATVVVGATLVAFLVVQGFLIGFAWPIQYVTAADALVILALAALPAVHRRYARTR